MNFNFITQKWDRKEREWDTVIGQRDRRGNMRSWTFGEDGKIDRQDIRYANGDRAAAIYGRNGRLKRTCFSKNMDNFHRRGMHGPNNHFMNNNYLDEMLYQYTGLDMRGMNPWNPRGRCNQGSILDNYRYDNWGNNLGFNEPFMMGGIRDGYEFNESYNTPWGARYNKSYEKSDAGKASEWIDTISKGWNLLEILSK